MKNKIITINETIEIDLLNKGFKKQDIFEMRKEASFNFVKKANTKKVKKHVVDSDLLYIEYKKVYYLVYIIEADVDVTDKNAFIGGNIIVGLSKKAFSIEQITDIDKNLNLCEYYAPLVFPSIIFKKGFLSYICNIEKKLFTNYALYNDFLNRTYDSSGNIISINDNTLIGSKGAYTMDGVAVLLEFVKHL